LHSDILKPVVVLIAWTILMLIWSLLIRFPAMKAAGIDMGKLVGTKGADADRALPASAQWKVHNYNHLLEQPVLFYAVCLVLAISGGGNGVNAWIAWAYVALRITHSLWQATVNRVAIRFYLFTAATFALVALTLHAAMMVFTLHG
jgi:hypothetical protein